MTWPTAPRKRSFPGFSIQLGANGSISPLLSAAGEVLASADSAFGLTLTVHEISMQRKFELGASKMQALGNISLLLLLSLPKTLSVVIYQSSFAFGILDLASFLFSTDVEDTKPGSVLAVVNSG